MTKKHIYSIFLLLILGLVACRQHPPVHPLLREAEMLMSDCPDSSLILLKSIPSPEKLSAEDCATWCLLITQARDKNYVKYTSDSVINVAVRYFEKQKDPLHYAKALYYKGRVFQDQGKIEDAATLFVKALDVGKDCQDYKLLFLISSRLGTLYGYQEWADRTLESYQKAYQYAIQSGDSSCLSFAYSYMGRAYSLFEEWEQSLNSYEKALSVATRIDDIQAMELAMNEYVAVCVNADRSDKIANYVDVLLNAKQEDEDKTGNLERFYFTIGDWYRYIGKYDNAIFYLSKSLQSENIYTLAGSSQSLYFLYEELKQYDKAVQYNNMYWAYTDSIRKIENSKAIISVETKYAYEKLQKENLQLKLKNLYWGGGSIIGFVAVSGLILVIIKRFRQRIKDKIRLISKLEIQMKKNRFQLIQENKRLEKKSLNFEQTIHLLRENIVKLNIDKVPDSPQEVSFALLTKIKKELSPLQGDEWAELFLIANLLHEKIIDRLSASFPRLKFDDLKLCCLTKLMFTNEEISSILDIQVDTLAKRKRRLSLKFDKEKWDKGGFNAYIEAF